jgi:hypothetical protein
MLARARSHAGAEVNDAGIAFRRAEIARTVADPADVEAEVRALFAALAR